MEACASLRMSGLLRPGPIRDAVVAHLVGMDALQVHIRGDAVHGGVQRHGQRAVAHHVLDGAERLEAGLLVDAGAVSYTHLDVYKRQFSRLPFCRAAALSNAL